MGGKQSTAARPRPPFPGVSTDDSAVPPSAHFGHFRTAGTMGLRSRSVSSVAGMGMEHNGAVPFGFYTTTTAANQAAPPRATEPDRAAAGQGSGSGSDSVRAHGYRETGGDGRHTDGVLYLGSRGSLADTLPLHIAPRWFSAHSGKQHAASSSSSSSSISLTSPTWLSSLYETAVCLHSLIFAANTPGHDMRSTKLQLLGP
ncbi:hypothetical protein QTP86_025266 [Hemibagrus guttatus]|nr:hypothetical protein QTP86_025266 [Hemibagrus guttatus]